MIDEIIKERRIKKVLIISFIIGFLLVACGEVRNYDYKIITANGKEILIENASCQTTYLGVLGKKKMFTECSRLEKTNFFVKAEKVYQGEIISIEKKKSRE